MPPFRPGRWLMGALPFDRDARSHLLGAEQAHWVPNDSLFRTELPAPLLPNHELKTADHAFEEAVRRALAQIDVGALEKVVVAREHHVALRRPIDWSTLLQRLRAAQPASTTYALALAGGGDGPLALVGSSPELLVSLHNGRVRCLPLAGSRARSEDPLEDAKRRTVLLQSDKDQSEHRLLVTQLAKDLSPFVSDLKVPERPHARSAGPMWHLATLIEGTLRDASHSVLDLVLAIYPTAAVCGVPRRAALEMISRVEVFDRGLYGGALGYMNPHGEGEWIVTLRGAEIHRNRARLLSGAGIVAGSDPVREAQETRDKLRSTLSALAPFL